MNEELQAAETKTQIAEQVIDSATEILGFPYIAVYLFDEEEARFRPAATSHSINTMIKDLPEIEPREMLSWQVFLEGEPTIIEDISKEDIDLPLFETTQTLLVFPIGEYGLLFATVAETSKLDKVDIKLTELLVTNAELVLERIRREQEIEKSSKRLRDQQVQLENRNQYVSCFRDIHRRMMSAGSRIGLEQAACEKLATLDRVAFAWTGRPQAPGTGISPKAWSGEDLGFLDAVGDEMQNDGTLPAYQSTSNKETVVVQNIAKNVHDGLWAKHAIERQYRSVISVPIVFDDILYGVLTAYSHQQNAFGGEIREIHTTLGELLGYASSNLVLRQSLNSDEVLLLEFDLGEPGCFIRQLARLTGCSLRFESLVSETDESVLVHMRATDGDPESIVEKTKQSSKFSQARQLGDTGTGPVELRVKKPLILTCLQEHGVLPRRLTSDGTTCRVLVEVASSADPRPVIELITAHHPDATLLSRQVKKQTGDTDSKNLATILTDRQREIAKVAYEAGYFEQPRKVTGEEIAESFGISGSAFSKHMQAIERKIFGQLFDINSDNEWLGA